MNMQGKTWSRNKAGGPKTQRPCPYPGCIKLVIDETRHLRQANNLPEEDVRKYANQMRQDKKSKAKVQDGEGEECDGDDQGEPQADRDSQGQVAELDRDIEAELDEFWSWLGSHQGPLVNQVSVNVYVRGMRRIFRSLRGTMEDGVRSCKVLVSQSRLFTQLVERSPQTLSLYIHALRHFMDCLHCSSMSRGFRNVLTVTNSNVAGWLKSMCKRVSAQRHQHRADEEEKVAEVVRLMKHYEASSARRESVKLSDTNPARLSDQQISRVTQRHYHVD